jgi:transcription elongation GreA/GreB family factor
MESFCQETISEKTVSQLIQQIEDPRAIIDQIPIVAFKKRTLTAIKDQRSDWVPLFLDLLFVAQPATLRDYVLKELQSKQTLQALEESLLDLVTQPQRHPEAFVWYFQKVISKKTILFNDDASSRRFFEAFLTLYHIIENESIHRDLLKKMYNLMAGKRWKLIRDILEGSSIKYCKELILLASKCQSLAGHDLKIIRSLAQVVHPELEKDKDEPSEELEVVWTTKEGLARTQERVRQVGEDEMVDNAKEIEVARAHGDLRENAEYKSALERRDRLQAELKMLSDELQNARVLTPEDLDLTTTSIGSVIELRTSNGAVVHYTVLGPWDADPENNILSFRSLLAKSLVGHEVGDKFSFRDEEFEVVSIASALEEDGAHSGS